MCLKAVFTASERMRKRKVMSLLDEFSVNYVLFIMSGGKDQKKFSLSHSLSVNELLKWCSHRANERKNESDGAFK